MKWAFDDCWRIKCEDNIDFKEVCVHWFHALSTNHSEVAKDHVAASHEESVFTPKVCVLKLIIDLIFLKLVKSFVRIHQSSSSWSKAIITFFSYRTSYHSFREFIQPGDIVALTFIPSLHDNTLQTTFGVPEVWEHEHMTWPLSNVTPVREDLGISL